MIYFVPAWYKQNKWCENEQSWYSRRSYSEFDETIKQIQLFHRSMNVDYKIILLSYAPNFRHFLHRQSMYRAAYWSCFDSIQQVKRTKIAVLSYRDLKWPEGTEFIYSSFAMLAYIDGHKYAKLEFGEDGNLVLIDMYSNDVLIRRNYYDDRGFVSCTIVYENGKEKYQDFLGQDGVWRIRVFFDDGHVEINTKINQFSIMFRERQVDFEYKQQRYESLEAVVDEVFGAFLTERKKTDKFFVAVHPIHMGVIARHIVGKNVIATIFENRYPQERLSEIKDYLLNAKYVITDSKSVTYIVNQKLEMSKNLNKDRCIVKDISPYDARIDIGISQQLSVQNILIPIDGLSDELFIQIILKVLSYLEKNDKARVHLFTRDFAWNKVNEVKQKLLSVIETNGYDKRWLIEDKALKIKEKELDSDEDVVEQRFFVDQFIDERNISKLINEQRVILDYRNSIDVFMYITAVSKGVPRISLRKDEFLVHKLNGYIVNSVEDTEKSLSYYLDNMSNWNRALVACYDMVQEYTTDKLINAWKEVIGISDRS